MREYAAGAGETYVRAYAGGDINNNLKRMTAHSNRVPRDMFMYIVFIGAKK